MKRPPGRKNPANIACIDNSPPQCLRWNQNQMPCIRQKGATMNITELAALAGVSKTAVSRYFNNGYLSPEKRAAIEAAVQATGYAPSEPGVCAPAAPGRWGWSCPG